MPNRKDENGFKQGVWFEDKNDCHAEGNYKDDNRHGYWIIRHDDGRIEEGSYSDGTRVGEWMSIDPDSRSIEKWKES